ncbi:hypothetical protein BDW72DRAFT_213698 [Aspergillus terricola var. indicus]
MSCNDISNFGFESGLSSWYTAPSTVASVQNGDLAYAGLYYLDIATTASNPSGTVSQDLYWLDNEQPYTLTVQFRLAETISSVNSCTVSAYLGEDPEAGAIASDFVWTAGSWETLTGEIQPTERNATINLAATCTFGGPGAITEGNVLFDEVIFGPSNC